jgi:hypothetical protein
MKGKTFIFWARVNLVNLPLHPFSLEMQESRWTVNLRPSPRREHENTPYGWCVFNPAHHPAPARNGGFSCPPLPPTHFSSDGGKSLPTTYPSFVRNARFSHPPSPAVLRFQQRRESHLLCTLPSLTFRMIPPSTYPSLARNARWRVFPPTTCHLAF